MPKRRVGRERPDDSLPSRATEIILGRRRRMGGPITGGGGSGPPGNDGILMEDAVFFVLTEDGDFVLQE